MPEKPEWPRTTPLPSWWFAVTTSVPWLTLVAPLKVGLLVEPSVSVPLPPLVSDDACIALLIVIAPLP
jgi:hypothetical protein